MISTIFLNLDPGEILEQNHCLTRELHYKKGKNNKKFAAIITPVKQDGRVIGLTISLRAMQEMQRYASKLVGYEANVTFDDIIGESPVIKEIKEKFKKAAIADSTILIQGESGTGKDLFARAIHVHSLRSKGPFVSINCAAIPETLLESELFGYEEGAFTGARRGGKPGKFELAHRGTIFLDEIGDMPLHLQVKLLKVLEHNSIDRVGGTQPIAVDVRIIAATHQNLEKMIGRQEFREDLYYRLSVIPVLIPPLRERKSDVKLLIEYFLSHYTQNFAKRVLGIVPATLEKMLNYNWPGNVRELENAIEYAVNMVNDDYIQDEHLPARVIRGNLHDLSQKELEPNIKNLEEQAIINALKKFGINGSGKEKAAKFLGISRSTIYRKLKEMQQEGKIEL